MAMSGLKDLSILDTAPEDRYPVQTYVVEQNNELIKPYEKRTLQNIEVFNIEKEDLKLKFYNKK